MDTARAWRYSVQRCDCKTVADAGEVGIKCFGYNFSCCGVQGYYSEVNNGDGRGAAAIKKFDEDKVDHSPLPSRRFWFNTEIERRSAVDVLPSTTPEQHWGRLKYFLENLCPVAEKYGMSPCEILLSATFVKRVLA